MSNPCLDAVTQELELEINALEMIAEISYGNPNEALRLYSGLPRSDFTFLRNAVLCLCYHNLMSSRTTEPDIRREFYGNLVDYLPGAVMVRADFDMANKPDGFVRMDGELIPVEIKRDIFDAKALKQLLRYMDVYGSDKGIAVAPELTCDLPDSIRFVAVNVPSIMLREKRLRRASI